MADSDQLLMYLNQLNNAKVLFQMWKGLFFKLIEKLIKIDSAILPDWIDNYNWIEIQTGLDLATEVWTLQISRVPMMV